MDTVPETIVWTAFCLFALGLALWRPDAGRLALGIFFIGMAIGVNVVFVLAAPDAFVDLGTSAPLLSPWGWVFEHVVAKAPAVFGLLVASYEVTIGLMMMKGRQWGSLGLIGGIIFLLVVAPLGPWAVPNLIMAAALGHDADMEGASVAAETAPQIAGAGRDRLMMPALHSACCLCQGGPVSRLEAPTRHPGGLTEAADRAGEWRRAQPP